MAAAALGSSPSWSTLFRPPQRSLRQGESPNSPEASVAPRVHRTVSSSPFRNPPHWLFRGGGGGPTPQTPVTTTFVPRQQNVKTPFLTVALHKLHETVPEFCSSLATHPHTSEHAARACALLDSSIGAAATTARTTASQTRSSLTSSHSRAAGTRARARSQSPVRRTMTTGRPTTDCEAHHRTVHARTVTGSRQSFLEALHSPAAAKTLRRQTHTQRSPTTSPATPLLQWFTSSTTAPLTKHRPDPTPLESEWDYLVAPLTLLTAALVVQADLQHCVLDEETGLETEEEALLQLLLLPALYRRIASDLLQVKVILCDPWMPASVVTRPTKVAPDASLSPLQRSVAAAPSLSVSLDSLAKYCTIRAQWSELQMAVIRSNGTLRPETMPLLVALLETVRAASSLTEVTQPLWRAMETECCLWRNAMEACCALEQCRYVETITALHKWKNVSYKETDSTRVSVLFRNAYRNIVALLPIYFDRVLAFSGTLYGFDTRSVLQNSNALMSGSNDWNSHVMEFLRRQEKGGGPTTAVAIVLDAVQTQNLLLEQGLQLQNGSLEEKKQELQSDPRRCWPAIYLRSTLHIGSPAPRSAPRTDRDSGSASVTSHGNLLQSWRKAEHPSPSVLSSTNRKVPVTDVSRSHPSLVEYDGSWPHSEWERLLVSVNPDIAASNLLTVSRMNADPLPNTWTVPPIQPVEDTRMEPEEAMLERLDMSMTEGAASLFDVGGSHVSPKSPFASRSSRATSSSPSTFHVSSISDYLKLVVIIRGEEESRWHRRRNPLTEEDIRAFLDSMATALRPWRHFSLAAISRESSARVKLAAYRPVDLIGSSNIWTDSSLEKLLQVVKSDFGLRPTQEGGTILSRNSPGRNDLRFSPGRVSVAESRRSSVSSTALSSSVEKSAAVFFMGSELATIVDQ